MSHIFLDTLGRNPRYGFRSLRKNPDIATVVILTPAAGVFSGFEITTPCGALPLE
jgi:hypothetical protein